MPVALRNTRRGPAVFSIPGERHLNFTWAGRGDATGADVIEIPDELIEHVQIRKMLSIGVLERVSAGDALEAASQQEAASRQRLAESSAPPTDVIERKQNNDLVSVPCQGPNSRGTGACGLPVPVRESARGDAPALCPAHSSLAPKFIEVDTGEFDTTSDVPRPIKSWVLPSTPQR